MRLWQTKLFGRSLGAAILACAIAFGALSCSTGGDSPRGGVPALQDFNVLLIVIDTLGAEHLGCYDPSLNNSPNIDYLARGGVLFRKAYTPAPWTQPAVASLFTSRMPSDHGVQYMFDELAPDRLTLAELMRQRGFRTAGVISHFIIGEKYGFAQGFEHLDESPVSDYTAVTSGQVTNAAMSVLNRLAGERFFLFVHYFDTHFFYNHHPDFDRTAWYDGRLHPRLARDELRKIRFDLEPEDIRYLVGLYREEIAFTDSQVGRLLAHLKRLDLTKKTLVILTSDHGEAFMEHGWIGHTRNLYDELLHVPLIVSLPGLVQPRVVDAAVSLLDVLPTLGELAGERSGRADWQGLSLAPHIFASGDAPGERELVAEVSFVQPASWPSVNEDEKAAFLTSLQIGAEKLIHDIEKRSWEFYDLAADPDEMNNLFDDTAPAAARLQQKLLAWEEGRIAKWGADFDTTEVPDLEAVRRIRALGYID